MGAGKGALVHVDADGRMRSIEDTETGKRTNRLDLVQREFLYSFSSLCISMMLEKQIFERYRLITNIG